MLAIGVALAVVRLDRRDQGGDGLGYSRAGAAEHRGGRRPERVAGQRPGCPARSTCSIEADDLTDPDVVEWMAGFKQRVLEANGFGGENPSCLKAEICPGPALVGLPRPRGGEEPTAKRIDATLAALSPYALRQVAPIDPETGEVGPSGADLVRDQGAVAGGPAAAGRPGARARSASRPRGWRCELTGLSVIAAESASDLSSSRYWLTLAGIALGRPGAAPDLPLAGGAPSCRWCRRCWRPAGPRCCSGSPGSR